MSKYFITNECLLKIQNDQSIILEKIYKDYDLLYSNNPIYIEQEDLSVYKKLLEDYFNSDMDTDDLWARYLKLKGFNK